MVNDRKTVSAKNSNQTLTKSKNLKLSTKSAGTSSSFKNEEVNSDASDYNLKIDQKYYTRSRAPKPLKSSYLVSQTDGAKIRNSSETTLQTKSSKESTKSLEKTHSSSSNQISEGDFAQISLIDSRRKHILEIDDQQKIDMKKKSQITDQLPKKFAKYYLDPDNDSELSFDDLSKDTESSEADEQLKKEAKIKSKTPSPKTSKDHIKSQRNEKRFSSTATQTTLMLLEQPTSSNSQHSVTPRGRLPWKAKQSSRRTRTPLPHKEAPKSPAQLGLFNIKPKVTVLRTSEEVLEPPKRFPINFCDDLLCKNPFYMDIDSNVLLADVIEKPKKDKAVVDSKPSGILKTSCKEEDFVSFNERMKTMSGDKKACAVKLMAMESQIDQLFACFKQSNKIIQYLEDNVTSLRKELKNVQKDVQYQEELKKFTQNQLKETNMKIQIYKEALKNQLFKHLQRNNM